MINSARLGGNALTAALVASLLSVCGTVTSQDQQQDKRVDSELLMAFEPPAESSIPDDKFGDMVRLGQQIFVDTKTHAADFVGNELSCTNCHLNQGRKPNSAPLWAAYSLYPAYRKKTDHVDTFEERIQGCFLYSMNGTPPPSGSATLTALVSYSYWLATGTPTGKVLPGRGYPVVTEPDAGQDLAHGGQVYQANCAICHGANGQGQKVDGTVVFPALWGDGSFNWGAGMHQINTAAGFIKGNMPLGHGGSLDDRAAWTIALPGTSLHS